MMNDPMTTAKAHANLALVKYFGKRDVPLNLPAAGSLSLTLAPLTTTTAVAFDEALKEDEIVLNDAPASAAFAKRTRRFLDLVRDRAGVRSGCRVRTSNNFPTAAGLASSASGFAALALAATRAAGLALTEPELSALARRGSGSASRSVPGGIVVWHEGRAADGSDSFAQSILDHSQWDICVVVGIASEEKKAVGSTAAMTRTATTSPYYPAWIDACRRDLALAQDAVVDRNFTALGEIAERSALSMHAAALAADPGIVFWTGTTVEGIHLARTLRKRGVEAYFTCDAGPQPKLVCLSKDVDAVKNALETLGGVLRTITCRLAGPASLV